MNMTNEFCVLPARPQLQATGPRSLLAHAPAKINLSLLVEPRRKDGFHDLDSFVAKVTLYDELDLALRDDGEIRFSCSGADCGSDENNLALRAARRLAQGRNVGGADIKLSKHILPGKGLAGGSSDAAAVLAGLNRLWKLDCTTLELAELGAELGSDVPLFLAAPTSRMTGRGEILAPALVHPFVVILCVPEFSCPTTEVYRAFDSLASERLEPIHPDALTRPPSQWRDRLRNQLAAPAMIVQPPLKEMQQELLAAAGMPAMVTGSGSALFVLCDDAQEASGVWNRIPQHLRRLCTAVMQNEW
jgi:4-diphosphocytidyl-2-C-methyl-D-erythritol kinase